MVSVFGSPIFLMTTATSASELDELLTKQVT